MIRTNLGTLDVFSVIKIRELQQSADLPVIDFEGQKIVTPTKQFLESLAELLQGAWGKAVDATQAYQVWLLCLSFAMKTREKFAAVGDIAHWFHLDATRMPEEMVLGLLTNLPRVKAQEQLNSGDFDPTAHESVYQLVMLATGDETQALRARSDSMRALIEQQARRSR